MTDGCRERDRGRLASGCTGSGVAVWVTAEYRGGDRSNALGGAVVALHVRSARAAALAVVPDEIRGDPEDFRFRVLVGADDGRRYPGSYPVPHRDPVVLDRASLDGPAARVSRYWPGPAAVQCCSDGSLREPRRPSAHTSALPVGTRCRVFVPVECCRRRRRRYRRWRRRCRTADRGPRRSP